MNTPTPWKASKNDEFCIVESVNRKLIADASGHIDMTDDEAEANAALIVRAVNSHQSLIDALEWYVKHDDSGENDGYYIAGLNAAKAALALAKEPT